ncbi:MAG TPA: acetolactate synthase small subunit [Gammaproteobacteria bacterium]|nr:acetolactate synthase small subunit [Gammaproteobacteria bacterium]
MTEQGRSVLKLTVNNHPGVMSHVCGLFSRRAYNLEGIMVMPIEGQAGNLSRMWLLLKDEERLDQIVRQTEKLIDVLVVERHTVNDSVFARAETFFAA